MGDVIVTDAKTLPAASDNEILVVEQYPGIPKPTNRLANGIYYSFKKVWYNFSKYLVPNSRTITINGDTKDLSENRDWTVDAGAIDSVADTNTVDLTVDVNRQLTADVKYQNTSTVNLSEDASGLKADLATGAAVTNLGYTPEDIANKTDVMSGNTTSSDKYLSSKGVYDWVNSVNGNIIIGSWSGVDTFTGSTAVTAFTGSSILVPANTYSVGDNVNFTLTGYRNSGGAAAVNVRVYVNTSNSLTGASIIGESNPSVSIQIIGLERRHINIQSATETNIGISGTGIDLFISSGTYTKAVLNIDWTIDQYIIPAVRLINGADSLTLLKFTVLK